MISDASAKETKSPSVLQIVARQTGFLVLVQDRKCDIAEDVEDTEVEGSPYEVLRMELIHGFDEKRWEYGEAVAVQCVQEKAFSTVQYGNHIEEHQVDEPDEEDEQNETGCENLETVRLDAEQPF